MRKVKQIVKQNGLIGKRKPGATIQSETWSGRRDSNSRLSPWEGDVLPLHYSRMKQLHSTHSKLCCKDLRPSVF
jgi:hypothetical protein